MAGRISTPQVFDRTSGNIATAREREMISSEKASTGKELVRPSQDPAGYMVSNALKDDLSILGTTVKNANAALKVLNMTETVFANLQDTIQRAYELAVAAAGENAGADASRKYNAAEVQTLYDSALQLLNTRYGSRTLLAGYKSNQPAFDANGQFIGDDGQIEIEVARGLRIPINISADRGVLGHGIDGGINILDPMRQLIQGLKMSDTLMIQQTLEQFGKANDQISLVRGEIGSRAAQIERCVNTQETVQVDSVTAVSEIEDADAVKVFSDLSRDQTVLKASISTANKILQENPTDIFYK